MLIILVCGSQLSYGVKLKCEFKVEEIFISGTFYSCKVTSLDNPQNNLMIEGYSGYHRANKNDADVKGILIQNKNTKYIPTNLGSFSNLTALSIQSIELIEIKAKDFHGMQDLESISFWYNYLLCLNLGFVS